MCTSYPLGVGTAAAIALHATARPPSSTQKSQYYEVLGRIERGAAMLEITLAIGQPALMVQTPVNVRGFKPEIDGTDWLCKAVEHSLDDNG